MTNLLGLRIHALHVEATSEATMEAFEAFGSDCAEWQRGVNWYIGDLARMAERRWPDHWMQIFPEWMSPDHIARCKAVSQAYKPVERNVLATWSIHMREANKPDRVARVQGHVDAGRTSDEARKHCTDTEKGAMSPSGETTKAPPQCLGKKRNSDGVNQEEGGSKGLQAGDARPTSNAWLLAVDVNYYVHRFFHSGAGVEAATSVADWVERLVGRLKEKGLTDLACCFDATTNHRKALTADWAKQYKPRPPKEAELKGQIETAYNLLHGKGFACVTVADMEADDVMASFAAQFDGRVTLLTQDKDARQCLNERVNILLDVEWQEDQTSGTAIPTYKWVVGEWTQEAKQPTNVASHTTDGCSYNGAKVTGITPALWPDFQAIAGDSTDGIVGAPGIGAEGAMALVKEFGSVDAAVTAAAAPPANPWQSQKGPKGGQQWRHKTTGEVKKQKKQPDDRSKEWAALRTLGETLDVTKQLVTMRTDLAIPLTTKL